MNSNNDLAHVLDLAQELGRSSGQIRAAAEHLGISLMSSDFSVDDRERLRRHFTEQIIAEHSVPRQPTHRSGGPGRPPGPTWRVGNNPFSGRSPAPRPVRRGRADETLMEAAGRMVRQNEAAARKRRPPELTGLAAYIVEITGRGGPGDTSGAWLAHDQAMSWVSAVLFEATAIAWMKAGLRPNSALLAEHMTRLGWTPSTLALSLGDHTVLDYVNNSSMTVEQIDALRLAAQAIQVDET